MLTLYVSLRHAFHPDPWRVYQIRNRPCPRCVGRNFVRAMRDGWRPQ